MCDIFLHQRIVILIIHSSDAESSFDGHYFVLVPVPANPLPLTSLPPASSDARLSAVQRFG